MLVAAKALFSMLSLYAAAALAAQPATAQGLISVLIYFVIVGLIFWVVWWFIGYVGVPEPFNKVLRVIIGLVALLIVVYFLLGLVGPMPTLR
jgi:uncharacterized membrane-anchored protein